jgi:predicted HTH domain antitoxin
MQSVQIRIDIPEEILSNMGKNKDEFAAEIKLLLATHLFMEKKVSLGKAAQIAELKRLDFMEYLQANKIDIYRYEDEELLEEFENIKRVIKE